MTYARALRRGLWLEGLTAGWNLLEGAIAVAAGWAAASIALVGFGVDSFVETTSAVLVGWRLLQEFRARPSEQVEAIERRTSRIAGALLLVLALYITVEAMRRLVGSGKRPAESIVGMVLTAVSLPVMVLLGRAKLKAAQALSSRSLRADAYETIACSWLSIATLSGLLLNAALGWWWADPAAALVLVPLIVREGTEGWNAGRVKKIEEIHQS